MGKAKQRSLKNGINDRFQNINNKSDVLDTITLFGFTAEEMLEAGAEYEDVMALGGLVE